MSEAASISGSRRSEANKRRDVGNSGQKTARARRRDGALHWHVTVQNVQQSVAQQPTGLMSAPLCAAVSLGKTEVDVVRTSRDTAP